MGDFLKAIPAAAASPYALIAYVVAAILMFAGGFLLRQRHSALQLAERSPNRTAAELKTIIETATNTKLPDKISAEDWLEEKRIQGRLIIIIAFIIAALTIIVIALSSPARPPTPLPGPVPSPVPSNTDVTTICCRTDGLELICKPKRLTLLLPPGASVSPTGTCECTRKPCCVPGDTEEWDILLTAIQILDTEKKDIRAQYADSKICLRHRAPGTARLPAEECIPVSNITGPGRQSIRATTRDIVRNGIDVILRDDADGHITTFNGKARETFSPNLVCNDKSAGISYHWDDPKANLIVNVMGYLDKP